MAWAAVVLKAAHLQILSNERLEALQQKQFRKIVTLPSRRGAIYDRHRQELAVTVPSYSLFADPKILSQPRTISRQLAQFLGINEKSVLKKVKSPDKRFVWIKRHLNAKQKQTITDWKIRGLGFIEESRRIYPNGALLSQVLGFVGSEGHGLEGLELKFNGPLRGDSKQVHLNRDARGRPLLVNGRLFADNPDGSSLELTIDREFQFKLENELHEAKEMFEADAAVGVILDAKTSEILAMANIPDYDLNRPQNYVDSVRRNRAVTDAFEPGSTMKTILMAGALHHGIIKPNSRIDCENGRMRVGNRWIREADSHHKFGLLSVSEILAMSSNVGTTKIALKMGSRLVRQTYADFGFGRRTGVELPGESPGVLHQGPWRSHLLANISFGHGMTASPLQIAAAYAAIASDGILRKPYLVRSIFNPDIEQEKHFAPQEVRRVLTNEEAATMRLMLMGVTAPTATGYNARIAGFPVGGKTGTAQKVNLETGGYHSNSYISSFAGFVPANDPKYVIYIAVDNPRSKFYGSQVAAPIFAKMAAFAVRKAGIAPVLITDKDVIEPRHVPTSKLQKKAILRVQNELESLSKDATPDLMGLSLREVLQRVKGRDIKIQVKGSGLVTKTWPAPGEELPSNKLLKVTLE